MTKKELYDELSTAYNDTDELVSTLQATLREAIALRDRIENLPSEDNPLDDEDSKEDEG